LNVWVEKFHILKLSELKGTNSLISTNIFYTKDGSTESYFSAKWQEHNGPIRGFS
jgi:hypothetical protein